MPVKIRLQRHGKKGKPFYWVVAADARAKRDGRYLEKIGVYNPNTNPATVDLNVDSAVKWLENGAQPTDTARTLLSYRGALLKHHLNGGVRKGALTQEEADAKFMAALDANEARKAAKQAALDLQAKEGDAEYEKMKPPPPPNGGYEEPTEEVLKMRATMEKVFMATLTDPHYQKHPVPMVRSQHSHNTCKELLDLCKLPEEEFVVELDNKAQQQSLEQLIQSSISVFDVEMTEEESLAVRRNLVSCNASQNGIDNGGNGECKDNGKGKKPKKGKGSDSD